MIRLAKAPVPDPAHTHEERRFAVQVAAVVTVQSEQYSQVPLAGVPSDENVLLDKVMTPVVFTVITLGPDPPGTELIDSRKSPAVTLELATEKAVALLVLMTTSAEEVGEVV